MDIRHIKKIEKVNTLRFPLRFNILYSLIIILLINLLRQTMTDFTNVTMSDEANVDPWAIGNIVIKQLAWSYYILANFIGVFLCSTVIYAVRKYRNREVYDIFVCLLASACSIMSGTCGMQCLLNMIHGERFWGADDACRVEAIAHVSAITTEFVSTGAMSLSMYYKVVHNREMSEKAAIATVVVIWLLCTLITILFSIVSKLYLVKSGLYCFFRFSSPAIAAWLLPVLMISLSVMYWSHRKIINHFVKDAEKNVATATERGVDLTYVTTPEDIKRKQFKLKSTLFIFLLIGGWCAFCVPTTLWELFWGEADEIMVTLVGFGGTSYSALVTPVYAYTSTSYREVMGNLYHDFKDWIIEVCRKLILICLCRCKNLKQKKLSFRLRSSSIRTTGTLSARTLSVGYLGDGSRASNGSHGDGSHRDGSHGDGSHSISSPPPLKKTGSKSILVPVFPGDDEVEYTETLMDLSHSAGAKTVLIKVVNANGDIEFVQAVPDPEEQNVNHDLAFGPSDRQFRGHLERLKKEVAEARQNPSPNLIPMVIKPITIIVTDTNDATQVVASSTNDTMPMISISPENQVSSMPESTEKLENPVDQGQIEV